MTLATDLDGPYMVSSVTDYDGPLRKQSDGRTEIKGAKTHRTDEAGCVWESTFEWTNDDKTEIKMTSVADPSHAAADFLLTRPDGSPTSDKVTYEAILKVMRKGDRVRMTGSINYGNETIILTMQSA